MPGLIRVPPLAPQTGVRGNGGVTMVNTGLDAGDGPGRMSLKLILFSGVLLGLVIVKVRVELAPSRIVFGLKLFTMDGGQNTLKVAVAFPPAPPSMDLTLSVRLIKFPQLVVFTPTVTVHEVPPVRVTPVTLTPFGPPLKTPPMHVVVAGVDTVIPAGKVSFSSIPVKVLVFGLLMVSVMIDSWPSPTGFPKNDFRTVGGRTTVRVSHD